MTAGQKTGLPPLSCTCFDADDALVEELWQTMIDNPTNYLEYAGGYVEIMEMREEAEKKAWGTDFPRRNSISFFSISVLWPFSVNTEITSNYGFDRYNQ